MDVIKIIQELNTRIANNFQDFKGSYLYGSRAKGNYKDDSDIDIVALFDEVNREKELKLYGFVGEIQYKYNVFIELHNYTLERLKKNPIFYDQVVNKGIFYGPT